MARKCRTWLLWNGLDGIDKMPRSLKAGRFLQVLLALSSFGYSAHAATSTLLSRGFTALPVPQKVSLQAQDFVLDGAWGIDGQANGVAFSSENLRSAAYDRFHLTLSATAVKGRSIQLRISHGAIAVVAANAKDRDAIAEQAYRLELSPRGIVVTGNSDVGLFYGIQTLVQLMKIQNGHIWLPEGTIEDWPDLPLRIIYWDDAHHLEHMDDLKEALRRAAFFKINGFAIKLEGHFEYKHAAAIVEPYALSPAQFQELTDYALKYHVQLIPYLDGPAHDSFILKHPEYSALRQYPESNYEFCVVNPDTYKLFEGMFDDLLEANKGGKYFVLSSDEAYYVGLSDNPQCQEAAKAKQLGSVGKLLAEFLQKTGDYLHSKGREVIFWGEFPLKPSDIDSLPNHLINGEIYGPQFDPIFRAHGIRQLIYTSTEGEEQLFPQYYILPPAKRLHARDLGLGRVQEMFEHISLTSIDSLSSERPDAGKNGQADIMGTVVAGWADPGLHPETFWLGYATGPAVAWNRSNTTYKELENSFYQLFYGGGATGIGRIYQLMSEQAQFWEDSWETGPSTARKPIWGESYGILNPPLPARDQFLPFLPNVLPGVLRPEYEWLPGNERRVELAKQFLAENDELTDLLNKNLVDANFGRYNLDVFASIANLYKQNLTMLVGLGRIARLLDVAHSHAAKAEATKGVGAIDQALDIADTIRADRNNALRSLQETWYKSWFPRVPEANGRKFLDEVDDVKDHQPLRTVDMRYLVYRQLHYPLGDWFTKMLQARNAYATAHALPSRQQAFNWSDTN
jgi:hexosaminidase